MFLRDGEPESRDIGVIASTKDGEEFVAAARSSSKHTAERGRVEEPVFSAKPVA
ncbi:MAG: hypothetical protein WBN07_13395 [Woeseiaceae bacterium]